MTPQEKAEELFNKFCSMLMHDPMAPSQKEHAQTLCGYDALGKLISDSVLHINRQAKKCALICVEETIAEIPMYTGNLNPKWSFWNDVKQELEKI